MRTDSPPKPLTPHTHRERFDMKPMPWFRLYTATIDDEKVRLLAFEDRWHFIALLCCKSAGLLDQGDEPSLLRRKLSVKLGLAPRELEAMAERLEEVGLIVAETFQPVSWDALQFVSDTSTARVRKFRDKKKAVSPGSENASTMRPEAPLHTRNVSVTPPDTDTDTEEREIDARAEPVAQMTEPGRACRLMRTSGASVTNPSHPDLLAALGEGVTPEVLADTVAEGVAAGIGRPFAWAIATARDRHRSGARQPSSINATGSSHAAHRQPRESRSARAQRRNAELDALERDAAGVDALGVAS